MNRRQALGGMAALTAGVSRTRSTHAAIEFVSDGFGLAIEDFAEIWGEGEPGQTYLQYPEDDGTWFIGQNRDGFVTYIERFWDSGNEGALEDAVEQALAIIPEEHFLIDIYRADFGAILNGVQVYRYESSSLADQLGTGADPDGEFLARTSFAIVYEIVPMPGAFDHAVRRFTIIHRTDPDEAAD